jgi:hypothetical protein
VPVTVVKGAKLVQLAVWQRSTSYPVTPTSSVLAAHPTSIRLLETAEALTFPGVDGEVVSRPASALNATSCITQLPPEWFGVTVYVPALVTFRSMVRFPDVFSR